MAILSADSFYKPLTPEQSKLAFANQYDFDHPQAFVRRASIEMRR